MNPPASELPRLIDEQTRFVVDLAGRLPHLAIDGPDVKQVHPGVWRVSVRVVNDGDLPLRAASGVKARRIPPLRVKIDLPADRVVGGEREVRAQSLAPHGGALMSRWLVAGNEGDHVTIVISSPELGDQTFDAVLSNAPAPAPSAPPPENQEAPR